VRCLAPLWAFMVAAVAAFESRNYGIRDGPVWGPGRVISFLQTIAMTCIGTALACGLYGPTVLPQYAYFPFTTLCTAFGTTTTLIMIVSVLTDFEALLGDHAIN
jgi:hypothetical protein